MSVATGADEPDPREREYVEEDVGCYEIEDGVVLYDETNPLAWIQSEGERGIAYVDVGTR